MHRPALFAWLLMLACTRGVADCAPPSEPAESIPTRLNQPALPNAQWVTPKVLSGGAPQGVAGFAALQQLGVRTVLSVDGGAPQVELAKRFGLRYVHLPHGYDGVDARRAVQLAKAVRDLPTPVYVHCHHGKHRSPAAAAVACVGAGLLPPRDALAVLTAAGTSPRYRGLYQAVGRAAPIDRAVLDALPADFPQSAPAPPMVEAMVAIEQTHDHLLAIQQAAWQAPDAHPDLAPAHQALLLREHFTELLRTAAHTDRAAEFWQAVRQSESLAQQLESTLRRSPIDPTAAKSALAAVTNDCRDCHAQRRDKPASEK